MPQRFSASDGQPIAYETAGAGDPVLCIGGGPGLAAAYLGGLGGLGERRSLVLPDTRGTGGSRPAEPDTLTVLRLADDIDELRAHLGLAAVAVLGHSYGCRVAESLAAAHPQVVSALVLITPAARATDDAYRAGQRAILDARADDPVLAEALDAAWALPTARPRERGMLEQLTVPLWYGDYNDAARAHAAAAADRVSTRTAFTLREAARGWTAPSAPDCPVLVVAGQLDLLTPPVAAHRVADELGATYVEIEGAGHFPWLDAPDAFAGVVADWLDGV